MATSFCTGVISTEKSRVNSPCRREGPFQPFFFISGLWGIYRTYLYSQSSAQVVFFFKISILELELQMTSITEKRKRKTTYEPFFYNSHCIFHFRKKNDYMSSQHFLRHVLRINNKKHANFMDEYLIYQKVRALFSEYKKRMQWLQTSFFANKHFSYKLPFSHSIKHYFNATFQSGGLPVLPITNK